MSKLNATAISVAILGGIATWFFLSVGTILIWAAFVAWACFFHSGGDGAALRSTLISNTFGVFVASTTALLIAAAPFGDGMGPIWPALVVTVSIALYIMAAKFPLVASVPGTTLGYASTFAFLLQTPDRFSVHALLSPDFTNGYLVIPVSMWIGALFAYASAKFAGVLAGKSSA